jgi:hemolysin III
MNKRVELMPNAIAFPKATAVTANFEEYVPTVAEEVASCITHGIGALLSMAGLVVLAVLASTHGTALHVVSCTVFGSTMVLLYLASTLYHGIPFPRVKQIFQVLDHCAIYLLIAGSYTPFTLVTFRGPVGWSMFGLVWGLALVGILLQTTPSWKTEWLRMTLYIAMGWLVVIATKPFILGMPLGGLLLVFFGGVAYTAGIIFYRWRTLPYNHAIWHLFVLAGSMLHFLAVLWYVIP